MRERLSIEAPAISIAVCREDKSIEMDCDNRFQPIEMGLSLRQAGISIPDGEAQIRPYFRIHPFLANAHLLQRNVYNR